MKITLKEYAEHHGKAPVSVRQMIARGSLKTAEKIGGNWMIDPNEPYPDNRRRDGEGAFEMRNGMYVIDEIAYRVNHETTYVRIGDQWYRKGKCRRQLDTTNPAPVLMPADPWKADPNGKRNENWFFAAQNYGCLPRDTTFIRDGLKRAASEDEVAAIAARHDAVRAGEKDETLGRFYGPEYEVTIRKAILRLPEGVNPITVEHEIRSKGIEAGSDGGRNVSIRIG
ncbi:hypothetical protein JS534_10205 [Bifidobacterium felsineum]|nr:hypothetical protein [Bifidobacterium felsineum]MBT1164967.1 hypothetical protein [Bifidobacterium felsineum]